MQLSGPSGVKLNNPIAEPVVTQASKPLMSANSAPQRVTVTFHGGPCEGTVVLGEGQSSTHATAAMAYRRYRDSPTSVVGCHVWDGMCQGERSADYYTIAQAVETDGQVVMVCEYDGAQQPSADDSK